MRVASDAVPLSRAWLERWSPVGGLLFVILGVLLTFTPAGDDTGETPADVIEFADEQAGWIEIAQIFALLSVLLLTWFVVGVYARLRASDAGVESILTLAGGIGFTLLFFLAMTVWNAPLIELGDEEQALQQSLAESYLALDDVGWVLLGGAGVSAGVMIIAASLGAMQSGWIEIWTGWLGVVLGVVALFTIAFVGIFAWLIWILGFSILLLMRALSPGAESELPSA